MYRNIIEMYFKLKDTIELLARNLDTCVKILPTRIAGFAIFCNV